MCPCTEFLICDVWGSPSLRAAFFEKTHLSGDRFAFWLCQVEPPRLELVRVLDFPGHGLNIPFKGYPVDGIFGR